MTKEQLDAILRKHEGGADELIPILQEVQSREGYLPEESLTHIAGSLGVTRSFVHSVASFYDFFSFQKRGKYVIKVCDGTTCHSWRSQEVLDTLYQKLDIDRDSNTSGDGMITVETVSCLGICSHGPNVEINGHIFPHVTLEAVVDYVEMMQLAEEGLED